MSKFRIKTSAPKGRKAWEPDMSTKVQSSLFATVAMIVASSVDAEAALMKAIADAKAGKMAFPAA